MHLRLFDYVLWFLTPVVLFSVMVAIMRRKLGRQFPFFLYYIILQTLADPILALVHARFSYTAYYYAYYVDLGLSFAVSAAVLWEIYQASLGRSLRLNVPTLAPLLGLGVVVFAVLTVIAGLDRPFDHYETVMAWILLADRTLRWLQVATTITIFLFATQLGISRRSVLWGIPLGFGFFASINILVAVLASQRGISTSTLSRANSLGYLVVCFVWLFYILRGTRDPSGYDPPSYAWRVETYKSEGKPWTDWFFHKGPRAFGAK